MIVIVFGLPGTGKSHLILQSTNDNINEMLYKAADYLHLKDDKRANQ